MNKWRHATTVRRQVRDVRRRMIGVGRATMRVLKIVDRATMAPAIAVTGHVGAKMVRVAGMVDREMVEMARRRASVPPMVSVGVMDFVVRRMVNAMARGQTVDRDRRSACCFRRSLEVS